MAPPRSVIAITLAVLVPTAGTALKLQRVQAAVVDGDAAQVRRTLEVAEQLMEDMQYREALELLQDTALAGLEPVADADTAHLALRSRALLGQAQARLGHNESALAALEGSCEELAQLGSPKSEWMPCVAALSETLSAVGRSDDAAALKERYPWDAEAPQRAPRGGAVVPAQVLRSFLNAHATQFLSAPTRAEQKDRLSSAFDAAAAMLKVSAREMRALSAAVAGDGGGAGRFAEALPRGVARGDAAADLLLEAALYLQVLHSVQETGFSNVEREERRLRRLKESEPGAYEDDYGARRSEILKSVKVMAARLAASKAKNAAPTATPAGRNGPAATGGGRSSARAKGNGTGASRNEGAPSHVPQLSLLVTVAVGLAAAAAAFGGADARSLAAKARSALAGLRRRARGGALTEEERGRLIDEVEAWDSSRPAAPKSRGKSAARAKGRRQKATANAAAKRASPARRPKAAQPRTPPRPQEPRSEDGGRSGPQRPEGAATAEGRDAAAPGGPSAASRAAPSGAEAALSVPVASGGGGGGSGDGAWEVVVRGRKSVGGSGEREEKAPDNRPAAQKPAPQKPAPQETRKVLPLRRKASVSVGVCGSSSSSSGTSSESGDEEQPRRKNVLRLAEKGTAGSPPSPSPSSNSAVSGGSHSNSSLTTNDASESGDMPPEGPLDSLHRKLCCQVEYYFSVDNLCKDIFLRSNMDAEGFVPLLVLCRFNRVRSLSRDTAEVFEALQESELLEVKVPWSLKLKMQEGVRKEKMSRKKMAEIYSGVKVRTKADPHLWVFQAA